MLNKTKDIKNKSSLFCLNFAAEQRKSKPVSLHHNAWMKYEINLYFNFFLMNLNWTTIFELLVTVAGPN